ncbi:Haloacid dehalogenase-like hydrolase-domain-containing protein [Rostrohypoxylon terebratum]|nr:Haloacid dehalogenase-like hydrolase-domain-containing protein [Rostrohypoxylon terebratum]
MDSLQAPPRGILFDVGDVLLFWPSNPPTIIPLRELKKVRYTPTWYRYERGEITQDVCYELCAEQFSLSASEIAQSFVQARQDTYVNHDMISFIKELKKDPAIQVCATSNVGKEEFEEVGNIMDCLAGNQVIFIDDKEENVCAAQALSIRGLVHGESTIHSLREIFDSPINKGWRYLFRNGKHCDSVTNTGVAFTDNFARLMIMDLLKDSTMYDLSWGSKKTWNFFAGETSIVPGNVLPDDLDTTSLALIVLRLPTEKVMSVLDVIAEYVNDDGAFQTYFDRGRARTDPIVSANILTCFYSFNRGHEFKRTLELIRLFLVDRSYLQGTRYYPSPDCCLGLIGRLLRSSHDSNLHLALEPLLKMRMRERLGLEGNALDLAMRIITCAQLGIACEGDRHALLSMQCEDGSWEAGWVYQCGSTGVKIGNRSVTVATAIAALSTQDAVT